MSRRCSITNPRNDMMQHGCSTCSAPSAASTPSESIRVRHRHNRASPRKSLVGAGGSLEFSHIPISTPPESPCNIQGSPRPSLVREEPTAHRHERISSGNFSDDSYIAGRLTGSDSPSSIDSRTTRSSSEFQFDRFDDPTVLATCTTAYEPRTPIAIANCPRSTTGSPLSDGNHASSRVRTHYFRSRLSQSSALTATSHIFPLEYESIELRYEVMETPGLGASGVVRRCIERNTGLEWACKTISKHHKKDVASLKNEVAAMLELMDHSYVVSLHDVVEDEEVIIATRISTLIRCRTSSTIMLCL